MAHPTSFSLTRTTANHLAGLGIGAFTLPWFMSGQPFGANFLPVSLFGITLTIFMIAFFVTVEPMDDDELVDHEGPPWDDRVFAVIEWRRFECLMEKFYEQRGFRTRSQPHGADGGVDVWLMPARGSTKSIGVVQCKHWANRQVGVEKVRELRGVMAAQGIEQGHFATTSTYTKAARVFARQAGIELLDAAEILRQIHTRTKSQQRQLMAVAVDGDYRTPTCASCGSKMRRIGTERGGQSLWGCKDTCRNRLTTR